MTLWSPRALLRLSFAQQAASLSDRTRDKVVAVTRPGERLVEAALAVSRDANALLVSAVAAERADGVSWEQIGEQLGSSRQAAQKRFGADVDHLRHGVLLPFRNGWFAGPSCSANPEATAEQLDAWLRERPGSSASSLSTLHDPTKSSDLVSAVTELSQILTTAFGMFSTTAAPAGVDERYVRQRLLEFTIASCEALEAAELTSESMRENAAAEIRRARAELAELHAEIVRGELEIRASGRDTYFSYPNNDGIAQDVALLTWIEPHPTARLAGGWLVTPVGPDGHPHGDDEYVSVEPDADRNGVAHGLAAQAVSRWIGAGLAQGITPFDEGGVVGPS